MHIDLTAPWQSQTRVKTILIHPPFPPPQKQGIRILTPQRLPWIAFSPKLPKPPR